MVTFSRLMMVNAVALMLAFMAVPAMAQFSTPVRDVENPARTPFRASATINIANGFSGVLNSPIATIAENQRLVIEQVSVRCATASGNIVRVDLTVTQRTGPSSSTGHVFSVPVQFQGADPFAGRTFVGGISSRMYSDAGILGFSSVNGGVIRDNGTGTGFCAFAISGYTIQV